MIFFIIVTKDFPCKFDVFFRICPDVKKHAGGAMLLWKMIELFLHHFSQFEGLFVMAECIFSFTQSFYFLPNSYAANDILVKYIVNLSISLYPKHNFWFYFVIDYLFVWTLFV